MKVIEVESVSKKYELGTFGTGSLRGDFQRLWARIARKEDPNIVIGEEEKYKDGEKEYWALKNITFSVNQGEVLGVIGKNGAGKSTLLKILSRITLPTEGRIRIKGRIASLLEVGTGFHPELSGRENIFLNGAILGMTKAEIHSKFDEIVQFAGVEKYIDTPVKRYSSGMYVRLAFAVAAHLEPEILIVDEVLAVGDAEFQKKCLGKMKDVSTQGRTVLFVSHNMAAVKQLCNSGIVLKNGNFLFQGSALEAVNFYQNSYDTNSNTYFDYKGPLEKALGNKNIKILSLKVRPLQGEILTISSGFEFELKFYNHLSGINLDSTFELRNTDEVAIFHHGILLSTDSSSKEGVYTVIGRIEPWIINAGTYKFKLIFGQNQRIILYEIEDILQFEILNEAIGSNSNVLPGVLRMEIPYKVNFENRYNEQLTTS